MQFLEARNGPFVWLAEHGKSEKNVRQQPQERHERYRISGSRARISRALSAEKTPDPR